MPTLPTGVIGPLWQPAHPSGITHPSCSHQAPQSCDECDGTLAEQQIDPAELGEPCIAFDEPHELCARRAEPGSPYCVTHQFLDVDLPMEVAA